jgi:hypothetical protein
MFHVLGKITKKILADKTSGKTINPGRPASPTKSGALPPGVSGHSMTGRKAKPAKAVKK